MQLLLQAHILTVMYCLVAIMTNIGRFESLLFLLLVRILLRQMFLTIQDSFTSKLENILAKAWKGRCACEQFEACEQF